MTPRLPDFVIIGAQKAGTTWLGARLAEQSGLFLSRPMEVHFFDRDDNYAKGVEWYASHFTGIPSGALIGEKTPDYFWTEHPIGRGPNDIPQRMRAILPDAKLIVVLRDPVKRGVSALNHYVRVRWLSPFVRPDALFGEGLNPERDRLGLVGRGRYLLHLQNFLRHYRREQLHVVFFEDDIVKAPRVTLDEVMRFLGRPPAKPIPPRRRPENRGLNSRLGQVLNYYMPKATPLITALDRVLPRAPGLEPSPACRARLYEFFERENRALFEFLGRGTEAWNGV